ncbi:hypothetical protein RJT34_27099 [Clitoria ternatea]|uniref:Peptidase M16 C-terminal domain-containing protein n=1 Tax=Clitoria ternatea TaxID=43366 RepID=A0AAN9I9I7_CLITE
MKLTPLDSAKPSPSSILTKLILSKPLPSRTKAAKPSLSSLNPHEAHPLKASSPSKVEGQTEEVIFDHLHATAFQYTPLGRTILGPAQNIKTITKDHLQNYIQAHYTAPRMVIAASGAVKHEDIVEQLLNRLGLRFLSKSVQYNYSHFLAAGCFLAAPFLVIQGEADFPQQQEQGLLERLGTLAVKIGKTPLKLELGVEVIGKDIPIPLYITKHDVLEVALGDQMLNVSIIQFWMIVHLLMDYSLLAMDAAALAGIVAILLISYLFIKRARGRDAPKPPIASGCWPLFGHLHLLGASAKPLHETLADLAENYGPIFTIRIGAHPAVVVNTRDLAKECFTTLDVIVSSRPKFTAAKILGHDYANFAFTPYGDFWRQIRKIVVSELFSPLRFELLRGIRDSEVQSSLKEIYRAWVKKRGGSDYFLVEMKQWLGDMSLNVMLRKIAGKRYSVGSGDEQHVRRIRRVFREFFRLTGLFVVGDAFPFLGWLDLDGEVKNMKETAAEMDSIVGEWLQEHRRKRDSGETKTEHDLIDVLLSVLDGVDLAGYDADTVNKATCLSVLAGATDTTTVSMVWAVSLLLNHPDVLKKVQDELDEYVGRERLVNDADIKKLIYLQAVVKETLRLYPPGPLSGPREFTEDCTLGGYHIQGGTRFILNVWKLQRDPRVWSEPLKFQPERFLTTHKGVDVRGQHYELLPFGGGRRCCPGISFGFQLTNLALAAFFQAFEVTTPSNAEFDMSPAPGLTNMKATPLEVLVKPRLSYQLLNADEA